MEDQVKGLKLHFFFLTKKGTRRLNEYLSGRSWKVCETEVKGLGLDLPGSPVVRIHLPVRETRVTPGLGRSLHAGTTKAMHLSTEPVGI